MADHPILFSGPMVRAILDGTKTQTRRVVKPQPAIVDNLSPQPYPMLAGVGEPIDWFGRPAPNKYREIRCPYGVPGDLLWVRETWTAAADNPKAFPGRQGWRWWHEVPKSMRGASNAHALFYQADGVEVYVGGFEDGVHLAEHWPYLTMEQPRTPPRWHPSIFMPRWAARILLRVTDVRVERLQEISDEDSSAEGIGEFVPQENRSEGLTPGALAMAAAAGVAAMPRSTRRQFLGSALAAALGFVAGARPWDIAPGRFRRAPAPAEVFQILWDSINAKRGYGRDVNPWVWVVSFERAEAPHA